MEIEHLASVDSTRADLEQQHEEVIMSMKQDYDSQLNQQQQLVNVSNLPQINHCYACWSGKFVTKYVCNLTYNTDFTTIYITELVFKVGKLF